MKKFFRVSPFIQPEWDWRRATHTPYNKMFRPAKKIDPHLKAVLKDFSRSYLLKREQALAGLDFEALRTELAEVKDKALENSEELLGRFEANARRRGARVYRAKDGAEANRLVYEIMDDHQARFLVKSKSMISEETELNAFLAKKGIEARETDLGEWIVQLGAELPTHMVMPAIHLSRADVAQVFSSKLGRDVPEDIPSLVGLAREELRREIFRAGAGFTGANALIAENGAVMIVTNEGNGRLCSIIPPVHIVFASIEKVLPAMRSALLLLKLLPRNATGQTITSYVSFIAPSPQKPMHIILLDNHRSEILANPTFREILRCIKCSACLNVCPVYQMVGGKKFAHIYMGGIGTLLTAWIHGLKESRELADYCLGCHRCEAFCATNIRIADLIISLREQLYRGRGKPLWKRLAFDGVMGHPELHQNLLSALRAARPAVGRKDGFARKLPRPLKKFDRFRSLPAPVSRTLSRRAKTAADVSDLGRLTEEKPPKIVVYGGCLVEHFYPEVGEAALRVLSRLGHHAALTEAVCCGFPSANSGFRKAAAKTFRKLVAALEGADTVLTLCPTCATMLTRHGPEILGTEKARRLAEKVVPLSRFLLQREKDKLEKLLPAEAAAANVTYHDSCHHRYILRADRESRRLLELALGKKIVEMEGSDACCGFAGTFSVTHPEVSEALLEDKLEAVRRTEAGVVALDCPGCLMQIRGGCERQGVPRAVKHTVQIVDERLLGKG